MSYDFSFDKKSVILIAIGCIAIGILLFFAGYIVGLDKGQSQPLAQASSLPPAQPEANSTAAKEPTAAVAAKPSAAKPEPLPAPQPKPATEPSKEAAAPASAENKSSGSQPDAKTPDPKSPDAKNDAKNGDPKNATEKDKDKDKAQFSLQLGAFQTEDNALKLRDNLKSKGYPVFLFRVLDPDGHLWHTVRMGHYGDMKEASQAAAKMTGKEEISAWVRPSNAF